MEEFGIPAAIVGIWVPGRGSYVTARGMADMLTGRPADPHDKFRIACITKSFTSTVILQLVDEGKLSLDDSLGKFALGVNAPNPDSITIRELLNHTSGLYNFSEDPGFKPAFFADPRRPWTAREKLALAISHPAVFPPGSRYKYNNTEYELLELIIEKTTGNAAETEIRNRIINRLGLKNTGFPDSGAINIPAPRLNGYMPGTAEDSGTTDLEELVDFTEYVPPAQRMYSNLDDLKTWAECFAEGRLLSPSLQQTRLRDMVPKDSPQAGPGYLYVKGFIGRSGSLPGYNSAMYYDPRSGTIIVAVINRYPCQMEDTVDEIWVGLLPLIESVRQSAQVE